MKKSYYLENILERHLADARHFLKPTDEEIYNLKTGDEVRLFFVMNSENKENCRAERMWVEITEIKGGNFKGILNNQPHYIRDINEGDEIEFTKDNIATVIVPSSINENLGAMISIKALKEKQINYLYAENPSNKMIAVGP